MIKICRKGHEYTDNKYQNCTVCRKIYLKNWHLKIRKGKKSYLKKHKEINKKYYDDANSTIKEFKRKTRGTRLKTRYWPKLTWEQALQEYDRMLADQEERCKICRVHVNEYKRPFDVDHDHDTLQIRGLLCPVCNRYVIAGIDMRAKAKKVTIEKRQMILNILSYYEDIVHKHIGYANEVCYDCIDNCNLRRRRNDDQIV